MERLPFKHHTVHFNSKRRKTPSTRIFNQRTLIGTMVSLRENQRLYAAVCHVNDDIFGARTIGFGFKLDSSRLPEGLKLGKMSPKNCVEIHLEEDKIHAMIVAHGDDSPQLMQAYKKFVVRQNIPKLRLDAPEIAHWFSSENLVVNRTDSVGLPPTALQDFEKFRQLDTKEKNKSQHKQKSKNTSKSIAKTVAGTSADIETIVLDDDEPFQNFDPRNFTFTPVPVKIEKEETNIRKPMLEHFRSSINELKMLIGGLVVAPDLKNVLLKTVRTLDVGCEYLQEQEVEKFNPPLRIKQDNYFVPIYDRTFEKDNLTMIEGVLPVPSNSYRRAIKSLPEEIEPKAVISAVTKECFPEHWVKDVTICGANGRKSLPVVWNYQDPLSYPEKGNFEDGLGNARLRAFFDHAVRKSGRLSYDYPTHEILKAALTKALYNRRTKKNEKNKSHAEDESEADDISFSIKKEQDDDDDVRPVRRSLRKINEKNPFAQVMEEDDDDDDDENENEDEDDEVQARSILANPTVSLEKTKITTPRSSTPKPSPRASPGRSPKTSPILRRSPRLSRQRSPVPSSRPSSKHSSPKKDFTEEEFQQALERIRARSLITTIPDKRQIEAGSSSNKKIKIGDKIRTTLPRAIQEDDSCDSNDILNVLNKVDYGQQIQGVNFDDNLDCESNSSIKSGKIIHDKNLGEPENLSRKDSRAESLKDSALGSFDANQSTLAVVNAALARPETTIELVERRDDSETCKEAGQENEEEQPNPEANPEMEQESEEEMEQESEEEMDKNPKDIFPTKSGNQDQVQVDKKNPEKEPGQKDDDPVCDAEFIAKLMEKDQGAALLYLKENNLLSKLLSQVKK